MGAGLPVVCFDGKNNRRFMGENGIYAEDNKIEDLAKKMIWAVENPEQARMLGKKNKQRVEEVFSWNNSIKDTVKAFSTLTSSK
jgi:glycosyltransferase involved in cell wall biosynthesis